MNYKRGDIVEILLPSGRYAYAQQVAEGHVAPLTRVKAGVFTLPLSRSEVLSLMEGEDQFAIQFPLDVLLDSGAGRVVGVSVVPEGFASTPIRVFASKSDRNPEGWYIVAPNGERVSGSEYARQVPSCDQTVLPIWSVPSIQLFLRMIDTGWTTAKAKENDLGLPDRSVGSGGPSPILRPPHTYHFSLFRSRRRAEVAAKELGDLGLIVRIMRDRAQERVWTLVAAHEGPPNSDDADGLVERLVTDCGGQYTGNEYGPVN